MSLAYHKLESHQKFGFQKAVLLTAEADESVKTSLLTPSSQNEKKSLISAALLPQVQGNIDQGK